MTKTLTKNKTAILIVSLALIVSVAIICFPKISRKHCNVALIPLEGLLGSNSGQIIDEEKVGASSKEIVRDLLLAEDNPKIKAILLSIDSNGGITFAGEEIANVLKGLTKPNIAVIRSVGLSSAYWAATGADIIFSSQMSSVGGIGITASYLDQTVKDAMEGYKYIEIASVKGKDVGSPHRPLSAEERNSWIESVKQDHEIFVSEVAENRNLSVEDVEAMADGNSVGGVDAVELGLTDKVGDIVSAVEYISGVIGEKAKVCWDK